MVCFPGQIRRLRFNIHLYLRDKNHLHSQDLVCGHIYKKSSNFIIFFYLTIHRHKSGCVIPYIGIDTNWVVWWKTPIWFYDVDLTRYFRQAPGMEKGIIWTNMFLITSDASYLLSLVGLWPSKGDTYPLSVVWQTTGNLRRLLYIVFIYVLMLSGVIIETFNLIYVCIIYILKF